MEIDSYLVWIFVKGPSKTLLHPDLPFRCLSTILTQGQKYHLEYMSNLFVSSIVTFNLSCFLHSPEPMKTMRYAVTFQKSKEVFCSLRGKRQRRPCANHEQGHGCNLRGRLLFSQHEGHTLYVRWRQNLQVLVPGLTAQSYSWQSARTKLLVQFTYAEKSWRASPNKQSRQGGKYLKPKVSLTRRVSVRQCEGCHFPHILSVTDHLPYG